jgi:hypothetical protein
MKANSTFVYITHDPNFAITRTNSKILWSKKYIHPNYWDFEILIFQSIIVQESP